MTNNTINNIYDIANAFITDQDTTYETFGNNGAIGYKFIKRGLADYPYCITIYAGCGSPHKSRFGDKIVHYGTITVHRGTNSGSTRNLLEYKTKREVGSALDKKQSDAHRFISRLMSQKFFKIVDMAEKRATGQIKTTDNSVQLSNIVYRLKENHK